MIHADDSDLPATEQTFEQMALPGIEPAALPCPDPAPEPKVPAGELRDPRQTAFSFVGRGADALLDAAFDGERHRTAGAIYRALTRLASEAHTPGWCRATRTEIARRARVSIRTVVRYIPEFERIGLLEVVRARGGRHHQGNLYRLLQVPGDARRATGDTPSERGGAGRVTPSSARGDTRDTPLTKKKNYQEGGNVIPFKDRSGETRRDPYAVER